MYKMATVYVSVMTNDCSLEAYKENNYSRHIHKEDGYMYIKKRPEHKGHKEKWLYLDIHNEIG